MTHDLERLISKLKCQEPPAGFQAQVIGYIRIRQRRSALIRCSIFSTSLLISAIALIPAIQWVLSSTNETGFATYLSLLFSDTSTIMTAWNSFSLALLESLPVVSLISALVVLLLFLESAAQLTSTLGTLNLRTPNR